MLKVIGSCKEVSRLAAKGSISKLTFAESLALSFHKMMCKVCRGYSKELQQLAELAKTRQVEFSTQLDEERKERMKEALEKQISEERNL